MFGGVLLPQAAFTPHTAQPGDVAVMITLADGVSEADGEAAVQGVADRFGAPDVQTGAEYTDSVAGEVDMMLNVVYVLLALAIVIALMGIANTLSLSIHERTRELGLLRAVGQTRRQLRSMVRGEAVTVALFGTAGGVGLGLFLGWAMVEALADEGFTAFAVPVTSLAVVLVVGALAGRARRRPARPPGRPHGRAAGDRHRLTDSAAGAPPIRPPRAGPGRRIPSTGAAAAPHGCGGRRYQLPPPPPPAPPPTEPPPKPPPPKPPPLPLDEGAVAVEVVDASR